MHLQVHSGMVCFISTVSRSGGPGAGKVISESGETFGSRTELDHTMYLNLWIDLFLHRFLRLVLADPGATTVEYVTFSILLSFVNYNALFTYTMVCHTYMKTLRRVRINHSAVNNPIMETATSP